MKLPEEKQGTYPEVAGERPVQNDKKRQQYYLERFERLDPDGQKALHRIYAMAIRQETLPRHVVLAMTAAARNPGIFHLVVQNLSLRMSLNRAFHQNACEKAATLHAILEDFHIALDAFIGKVSLEDANRRRSQNPYRTGPVTDGSVYRNEAVPEWMLPDIYRFKEKFRPVLLKFRRSGMVHS